MLLADIPLLLKIAIPSGGCLFLGIATCLLVCACRRKSSSTRGQRVRFRTGNTKNTSLESESSSSGSLESDVTLSCVLQSPTSTSDLMETADDVQLIPGTHRQADVGIPTVRPYEVSETESKDSISTVSVAESGEVLLGVGQAPSLASSDESSLLPPSDSTSQVVSLASANMEAV